MNGKKGLIASILILAILFIHFGCQKKVEGDIIPPPGGGGGVGWDNGYVD